MLFHLIASSEPPKIKFTSHAYGTKKKLEVQCRETKAVEFFISRKTNDRSLTVSIYFLCIIKSNSVSSCQTYSRYMRGIKVFSRENYL